MKNNKITFSQFLSLCLISSLSSLMFLSSVPSLTNILTSITALAVNFFVFSLYKGQYKRILIPLTVVYLTYYCISVVVKFSDYMNTALSYGPSCLIIIVLLCFTFFCTVKGSEAVFRASAIIAFFVIAGVIYMLVCSFTNINFALSLNAPVELNSAILLLLPSFLYILYYDDIINYKSRYYLIYTIVITLIVLYFILIASGIKSVYPIQYLPAKSKIGVFKGSDCILLSILTISCVFSVTSTTVGLFKSCKHKYITNAVYIFALLLVSIVFELLKLYAFSEKYIMIPFTLVLILAVIILSAVKRKDYV